MSEAECGVLIRGDKLRGGKPLAFVRSDFAYLHGK